MSAMGRKRTLAPRARMTVIGRKRPVRFAAGMSGKRPLANNAIELPVEAGELETPDARLLTVSFLADFASRFSHPLESDL